jgi:hypothetical protein
MEVVNDSTAPQIEEILAQSPIKRTSPLPSPHMGQGVFDRRPFAQFSPPLWGLLSLSQFEEQCLTGMNAHTAPLGTSRALSL